MPKRGARISSDPRGPPSSPKVCPRPLSIPFDATCIFLGEQLAIRMYERLEKEDAGAAALFRGVDMRSQRSKLGAMFDKAVRHLEHPMFEKLVELGQRLGGYHARLGVKREHFDSVQKALVWALRETLGRAFDREMALAWTWFYSCLSDVMCSGIEQSASVAAGNNLLYGMASVSLAQCAKPHHRSPVSLPLAPKTIATASGADPKVVVSQATCPMSGASQATSPIGGLRYCPMSGASPVSGAGAPLAAVQGTWPLGGAAAGQNMRCPLTRAFSTGHDLGAAVPPPRNGTRPTVGEDVDMKRRSPSAFGRGQLQCEVFAPEPDSASLEPVPRSARDGLQHAFTGLEVLPTHAAAAVVAQDSGRIPDAYAAASRGDFASPASTGNPTVLRSPHTCVRRRCHFPGLRMAPPRIVVIAILARRLRQTTLSVVTMASTSLPRHGPQSWPHLRALRHGAPPRPDPSPLGRPYGALLARCRWTPPATPK